MDFRFSGQELCLPTEMQGCLTNIVRDDINIEKNFGIRIFLL